MKKKELTWTAPKDWGKRTYFSEFHNITRGLIIETCEGEGNGKDPMRLVYYIYTENLELIGKIDTSSRKTK